jgi:hypothetical protein
LVSGGAKGIAGRRRKRLGFGRTTERCKVRGLRVVPSCLPEFLRGRLMETDEEGPDEIDVEEFWIDLGGEG